jgi:hypothetical protein
MPVKNSNYIIGNRTRDLPVCTAVPQPTASPRTPNVTGVINTTMFPLWPARCWQVPDMPLLTVCGLKYFKCIEHKRFLSTKDLSRVPCVDASRMGRRCIWERGNDYLEGLPWMCSAPPSKCRDNAFKYSTTASNQFLFTIHHSPLSKHLTLISCSVT